MEHDWSLGRAAPTVSNDYRRAFSLNRNRARFPATKVRAPTLSSLRMEIGSVFSVTANSGKFLSRAVPAVEICNARNPRGASWGDDNRIVFAPDLRGGLVRVSANAGIPEPLTQLKAGEVSHRWPQLLP